MSGSSGRYGLDDKGGVAVGAPVIDRERCKGCGLCVEFCPFGHLRVGEELNLAGYHPAEVEPAVQGVAPAVGNPKSAVVKKVARFVGADLVGIGALHPNWVYSHEFDLLEREHRPLEVPEGIVNAVVIAVAMDYQWSRSAPSGVGGAATGLGCTRLRTPQAGPRLLGGRRPLTRAVARQDRLPAALPVPAKTAAGTLHLPSM